jgi:hypothetical protein
MAGGAAGDGNGLGRRAPPVDAHAESPNEAATIQTIPRNTM